MTYMASGPGEEIDAAHYDWILERRLRQPIVLGSSRLAHARKHLFHTNQAHSFDVEADNPWGLVPDQLPHMEFEPTTGKWSAYLLMTFRERRS